MYKVYHLWDGVVRLPSVHKANGMLPVRHVPLGCEGGTPDIDHTVGDIPGMAVTKEEPGDVPLNGVRATVKLLHRNPPPPLFRL